MPRFTGALYLYRYFFITYDHHRLVCFHYSVRVQMAAETLSTASVLVAVAVKAVLVALPAAVLVQMVVYLAATAVCCPYDYHTCWVVA